MKGGCLKDVSGKDVSGSNSHGAHLNLSLSFKTHDTSVYYLANLCMLAVASLYYNSAVSLTSFPDDSSTIRLQIHRAIIDST